MQRACFSIIQETDPACLQLISAVNLSGVLWTRLYDKKKVARQPHPLIVSLCRSNPSNTFLPRNHHKSRSNVNCIMWKSVSSPIILLFFYYINYDDGEVWKLETLDEVVWRRVVVVFAEAKSQPSRRNRKNVVAACSCFLSGRSSRDPRESRKT